MIKIFIPERAKQNDIGGGFTFVRNFCKVLKDKVQFVDNWQDCDIYFIPGPTLAERDEVKEAKKIGKKIVLRIDNIPKNSRNRNTGTSRLLDFSQLADEVIYQSQWAKSFIMPFIKKNGEVILNGADTDIFKKEGDVIEKQGEPQYLYSRYNRDENKRWESVWYDFLRIYQTFPKAHLWIVGKFSSEQVKYNFDFFSGAEKRYSYLGVIQDSKEMAKIYRSADYLFAPYLMDACSNVIVEAKMCGLEIICSDMEKYSSTNEIMKAEKKELTLKAMEQKYLDIFKKLA